MLIYNGSQRNREGNELFGVFTDSESHGTFTVAPGGDVEAALADCRRRMMGFLPELVEDCPEPCLEREP